jgi:hypothetical protein
VRISLSQLKGTDSFSAGGQSKPASMTETHAPNIHCCAENQKPAVNARELYRGALLNCRLQLLGKRSSRTSSSPESHPN